MAYDANNRQTAFCTAAGDLGGNCAPVPAAGRTLYHYDAQGNRVKKSGPSGTSLYVYDAFGKLAAEYKDSGTPTPGTFYRTVDHLGSTRLVTDGLGDPVENTDYLPFGEEIDVSSGDPRHNVAAYGSPGQLRHKFTGKERDTESGMDYFLARYYSGPMGRFLSVDPGNAGAGLADPQTWNAYAYVRNNPTGNVGPDGRIIETAFDVFSLVTGAVSFVSNVQEGNVGAAALDAVGVVADAAAVVLPGIPGGAGAGLKAFRAGGRAADALSGATKVADVAQTAKKADAATDVANAGTEVVQRAMSKTELASIESKGALSRGGRKGDFFVSDSVNANGNRARQRLALGETPEVRATLEVPAGRFSEPAKVQPANKMPGGGLERTAPGGVDIPAKILKVDDL